MKFLTQPIISIRDNWVLLWQFTMRDLAIEHKGSFLGSVWLICQPLLLMSVYTFVFSQIYNGRYGVVEHETSIHYAIGIFIGITILHLFNDTLNGSVQCIISNPNFVKKVVFPLEVIPLSIVLKSLYKFSISFLLIFLSIFLLLRNIPSNIIWFPAIIIPSVLFSSGISWLISAVGVYFRDISPLIQISSLCMLWLSAIFYSARDLPPAAWQILKYNPVLLNIDMSRDILLWGTAPNLVWLAYTNIVSLCVFFIGFWFFRKLKPTFADVL
jgi:lipopolysaccharide transport system permease protein